MATQAVFIRLSFYEDLGLGLVADKAGLLNYTHAFTDPFYLRSLQLTAEVSVLVVIVSLVVGYPSAYMLARMRSNWANVLLALLVISSFITIVIKVLGLVIIFGADGLLNRTLRSLGLLDQPIRLLGNVTSVVIGLTQYTIGFFVVLMVGVIRTIPRSLEEAAAIHGAGRWRVFRRVVVPISMPGVIAGALIVFNLSMGAFTSAALLGGGRVLTLPVLIQRTLLVETKYGMAATLSVILLITVLLINLISTLLVARVQPAAMRARQ